MSIGEVIIEVGDVGEAVEFYSSVCGFKYLRTIQQEGQKVAEMDAGDGQRVTLVPSGGPGVLLALTTKDARAEQRRLRRLKLELDGELPTEVPGGAWIPFTDPWGNRLGYWQDKSPGS